MCLNKIYKLQYTEIKHQVLTAFIKVIENVSVNYIQSKTHRLVLRKYFLARYLFAYGKLPKIKIG